MSIVAWQQPDHDCALDSLAIETQAVVEATSAYRAGIQAINHRLSLLTNSYLASPFCRRPGVARETPEGQATFNNAAVTNICVLILRSFFGINRKSSRKEAAVKVDRKVFFRKPRRNKRGEGGSIR
ncbi:unnamed protein product [Cylicocyclus nassatus]|uniref:Uncharacterized protein n=1 Tax=Cylicocyclus nassatus TaxID=53992 RepID=A0AA36H489_CYLNA|nr:unnamed protein product [Cylicocyclus nassatus]